MQQDNTVQLAFITYSRTVQRKLCSAAVSQIHIYLFVLQLIANWLPPKVLALLSTVKYADAWLDSVLMVILWPCVLPESPFYYQVEKLNDKIKESFLSPCCLDAAIKPAVKLCIKDCCYWTVLFGMSAVKLAWNERWTFVEKLLVQTSVMLTLL